MKAKFRAGTFARKPGHSIILTFIFTWLLLGAASSRAQIDPGGGDTNAVTYTPLETWSFYDSTNWTSDNGRSPVSFSNLSLSPLGNFRSLVVDSNSPAWLRFNVFEASGATNFTPAGGTLLMWYAPGNWSSTNLGGTGPGDYARLFEVGDYTTNSSYGWWSLYIDPAGENLYFSTQTNDSSGSISNYIAFPISWSTNVFHQLALTYSGTNDTLLYVDGGLVTNGPPLNVYPGLDVLTNGFYIGSSTNGDNEAHGLFNSVATYNVPLDAGTISTIFNQQYVYYMMNPYNTAMFTLNSATSSPAFTPETYSAISGAGMLQWVTNTADCVDGSDALHVWVTNITASAVGDGSLNVSFTIEGGLDGYFYDVFATSFLSSPMTNMVWSWLGQGQHCNRYEVNITSRQAFLMLGTPYDPDGDGISSAYESLISHTDPNAAQSDGYDVPYAWYVQNGLDVGSALQDPDQDALLNYQEYQYGTKPQVSEGFNVWTTDGNSVIP